MLVLGNILSGVSSVFLGLSTYQKCRRRMILFQIFDCIFAILSCLMLQGFSGACSNFIALVRNVCEYFKINTKYMTILLTLILLALGYYNFKYITPSLLVFLPVIASVEYTVCMFFCKNYTLSRYSLLINELLWVVYYAIIQNYVGLCTLFLLSVSTFISIRHIKDDVSDNGLTKWQRKQIKFEIENRKQ